MGTRNLTIVKSKGKTKVAQYGQWDGYPTGQGQTIAEFLKKVDLPKFKKQVEALKSCTSAEVKKLCDKAGNEWKKEYPAFSRDEGADVLNLIHDGITTKVFLDEDFKNDHTFCEYYYEIDLDNETVSMNGGKKYSFTQWKRKGLMEKLDNPNDE